MKLKKEMPEWSMKKIEAGKACTYCMFPFRTISLGHCSCFLMWFPLFIQHLLDNIGTDSQLFCHIGNRTMDRASTTEVKRKKLQCVAAQTESVCTVRHSWERWFIKSVAVIWQRSTLPVSSPSENTPSCWFSCCLIVDSEIKLNHTKSGTSLE